MSKRFRWLILALLTALLASLALTGAVAAQESPDDDEDGEETPDRGWWFFDLLPDGWRWPFGREFRFEWPDGPQATPWFGFEFQRPDRPDFRFEVRPGEVLPFLWPDDGMRQPQMLRLDMGLMGLPLEEVAEALGLTPTALLGALLDGQSVAEVAEAQGVALDDVVAVVIAPLRERVAQAVEDGRLTQEAGDERLAEAEERLRARLAEPLPRVALEGMQQMALHRGWAEAQQAMVEAPAGALGLTVEEYRDALQGDSTLWQLAEENGVTRAEVIGGRSAFDAAVQQAVDDGLLTAAEGEVVKERLTDKAIERLLSGGPVALPQMESLPLWPLMP